MLGWGQVAANVRTETMERECQTRRIKRHVTEEEVEIERTKREELLLKQRKRENIVLRYCYVRMLQVAWQKRSC